jgi:hypothetical protein
MTPPLGQGLRGGIAATLLCSLVLIAGVSAAPADAQPILAAPTVVAGPDPGIQSLGGMAIARDGEGGLVYLARVAGVAHVFVSRLTGGSFQAPEEVDASLPTASSQPVIAASNGGLLTVAFISGGELYAVDRTSTTASYTAPIPLAAGASNPALQMTTFGKAYLAFTLAGAGGHDVRSAFYDAGQWALEPTALDANPADDAGAGTGRPAVAAAGDGVAIVAWGEAGHIFTRRVWGVSPSILYEQADPASVSGWTEVAADEPSIGSGADSSYADVAFHEVLASGSQAQSRVLMSRLIAGSFKPPVAADGLTTPGPEGADSPQVLMNEFGRGYVTSGRTTSHQLVADTLGTNGISGGVQRVERLPNTAAPFGVPAAAGLSSLLIGWQQTPSLPGSPEIEVRYATGSGALGNEQTASTPNLGATDAASGLAAAGDVNGDAALAWVQGSGASTRIVTAQMYQPPGSFSASARASYVATTRPTLSWSAPNKSWGPLTYVVTLDGVAVAETTTNRYVPSAPLAEGLHTYQITAYNQAGIAQAANPATVVVDTIAPVVRVTVLGSPRAGSPVRLSVRDSDVRPPEPPADASGVKSVTVKWGDRVVNAILRSKSHIYRLPGLFTITVIVVDRAGNQTRVIHRVRVVAAAATERTRQRAR